MDSSTYKIIKYVVMILNLLLLLTGLALLGIGLWTLLDFRTFSSIFGTSEILFQHASHITIASGCFLAIIGFLGCYGAYDDNRCWLGLYFIVLFSLVLVEISGLIIAFIFNNDINSYIRPAARNSIAVDYGTSTATGSLVTSAWDTFQRRFDCCGYINGTDYESSVFDSINFNRQPWPASCCTINAGGGFVNLASCISDEPTNAVNSNAANGCLTQLLEIIRSYAVTIGVASACFVGLQVITLTLACILFVKSNELA